MNRSDSNKIFDVIISGAGPVGLFLACELALAKCTVLILERAEDSLSPLKKLPFGIRGLSAPTIESLDRRGLLEHLEIHKQLKNPHSVNGLRRQVGHFAGIGFHEEDVDQTTWNLRGPHSTPHSLISEMAEMETVLSRRAVELGVEIQRGCALSDFRQHDDRVEVIANDQTYSSHWLVGCDGARSIVRKVGEFVFEGTEPEFTGYTTKIEIADPEKLKAGRIVTEAGMYMQSQPGYVIIQDFDGGAFHDSKKELTLAHLQQTLRRVSETDVTIHRLDLATTWTDRARQTTTYRNRRVLLAGDAAHIHSPLGGQGLNLGLGDAMNLGWKLAAVIKGRSPEILLDSYENERRPLGRHVLDWSRAQVSVMKPGLSNRALYAVLRDLIQTRDGATYMAERVWGIHQRVDLGDENDFVGRSVPNFEFSGESVAASLRGGRGLLIDLINSPTLKQKANQYRDRIRYLTGSVKEPLGLSALLVRPDGVVAWAAESGADESALTQALNKWFGKKDDQTNHDD